MLTNTVTMDLVSYSANAFSSAVVFTEGLSLTDISAGWAVVLSVIICFRQAATSKQYSLKSQQHGSAGGCISINHLAATVHIYVYTSAAPVVACSILH